MVLSLFSFLAVLLEIFFFFNFTSIFFAAVFWCRLCVEWNCCYISLLCCQMFQITGLCTVLDHIVWCRYPPARHFNFLSVVDHNAKSSKIFCLNSQWQGLTLRWTKLYLSEVSPNSFATKQMSVCANFVLKILVKRSSEVNQPLSYEIKKKVASTNSAMFVLINFLFVLLLFWRY